MRRAPISHKREERRRRQSAGYRVVVTASSFEFLVALILAAAAGTTVWFHAERNRIRHPSAWASFVFLFLLAGLPSYALHVRRVRRRRNGQTL
jgi:hypothetical protein